MNALVGLIGSLFLLTACGPVTKPKPKHFFVMVHNDDSLPAHVKCQSWFDSKIVTSYEADIFPGHTFAFDLSEYTPDGVELETVAWKTSWGKPDYGDCYLYHIRYPSLHTDKEYLKQ